MGDDDPGRRALPLPAGHAEAPGEDVVVGRDHLREDLAVEQERGLQAGTIWLTCGYFFVPVEESLLSFASMK